MFLFKKKEKVSNIKNECVSLIDSMIKDANLNKNKDIQTRLSRIHKDIIISTLKRKDWYEMLDLIKKAKIGFNQNDYLKEIEDMIFFKKKERKTSFDLLEKKIRDLVDLASQVSDQINKVNESMNFDVDNNNESSYSLHFEERKCLLTKLNLINKQIQNCSIAKTNKDIENFMLNVVGEINKLLANPDMRINLGFISINQEASEKESFIQKETQNELNEVLNSSNSMSESHTNFLEAKSKKALKGYNKKGKIIESSKGAKKGL